jgi:dihydrofolate synthase/folylpolyglutamate synthase
VATAVTSIALDHTDYLGTTLRAIAGEKAGIIKPGVPCFIGRLPAEADEAIAEVAHQRGAPLRRLGSDFLLPAAASAPGLAGEHQRSNAAIAVALAEEACRRLGRQLAAGAVQDGLARVRWPGRLERIAPDVLLDCAHNPEGAAALAAALAAESLRGARGGSKALVISVVGDKDLGGVLGPLLAAPPGPGGLAAAIATQSRNPRALPAEQLAAALRSQDPSRASRTIAAMANPLAAVAEARRLVRTGNDDGLVVVAGSIFLVGEIRAGLLGEPSDPTPVSDPV